jgi:predicted nucleic acid-binding protein
MKTYVLDASALFVFLQDTPGASKVDGILRDAMGGRVRVMMSAANYGEVYGKILRDSGREKALETLQVLSPLPIEILDATPQRACGAAEVKTRYKLDYADSFAAALAIEYKAILITSDSDFRKLGRGVSRRVA